MDPVKDIARFGIVPGGHQWASGHPISTLRQVIIALRARLNAFEEAARGLEPWKRQSPLEWRERLARFAAVAVDGIEPLAAEADRARVRLQEVRSELVFKINRNDLAAELRRQEIRGGLTRLGDPLLVGAVLTEALGSDDPADADVVEAVLSAPGVLGLVDRETAEAARAAWARKVNPVLADEEADLEAAVATFEKNLAVVTSTIREAADLGQPDPVAVAAQVGEEVTAEV